MENLRIRVSGEHKDNGIVPLHPAHTWLGGKPMPMIMSLDHTVRGPVHQSTVPLHGQFLSTILSIFSPFFTSPTPSHLLIASSSTLVFPQPLHVPLEPNLAPTVEGFGVGHPEEPLIAMLR